VSHHLVGGGVGSGKMKDERFEEIVTGLFRGGGRFCVPFKKKE